MAQHIRHRTFSALTLSLALGGTFLAACTPESVTRPPTSGSPDDVDPQPKRDAAAASNGRDAAPSTATPGPGPTSPADKQDAGTATTSPDARTNVGTDAAAPSQSSDGAAPSGTDGVARGPVPVTATTPMPAPGQIPIKVLNLPTSNWKITRPDASEVKDLSRYSNVPEFYVDQRGYVNFRAVAGGSGTKNSSYPRSELRELPGNWSTNSGTHTMTLTQAITYTLVEKQHVVAGQIHDAEDDVVMIRLEGRRLFVEARGMELAPDLDSNYQLGTKFTVKIEASNGTIRVFFNDMTKEKVSFKASHSGCYFKAGVYTQSTSNAEQTKGDRKPEDPKAYGEVHIYEMKVTHQP